MVKALLALCAAAFLAAPSTPAFGPGTRHFDGSPPLRFMGDATAITFFVMDVDAICGAAPPGYTRMGCQFQTADGVPVIVVKNPCPYTYVDAYARLICHEIAHARLWPGDHPL
jgi:hypothetical protein